MILSMFSDHAENQQLRKCLALFSLLITLLGCQSVPLATPLVPPPAPSPESVDFAPIAGSQTIQKVVHAHRFTVDRGFELYWDYFGEEFKQILDRIGARGHWIDGGAGNAYAQKDYLGSRTGERILPNRPRMTAVTYKYPAAEPLSLAHNRFRVLSGRYFEDIPLSEFEPADIITDVTGVLNYTEQLDLVLTRYLELLKPDGVIFVMMPSHTTRIERTRSVHHGLFSWLRSIPGLRVEYVEKTKSPYPREFAFTIRKVGDGIRIPKLRLKSAEHRTAVYRVFELLPH